MNNHCQKCEDLKAHLKYVTATLRYHGELAIKLAKCIENVVEPMAMFFVDEKEESPSVNSSIGDLARQHLKELHKTTTLLEPSFVYVITLKQHPNSKWLNWRSFFSESRYRQSNIGKIRLTTSLEHYDGLNELYNDPDITEVHKWFGLHKSVSKAERSNLHLLCILPEAWSYIQGIKDSEPLWSNIDHAQQAMSELAKLAPKNAKSDSEEKSENLVDNDRL